MRDTSRREFLRLGGVSLVLLGAQRAGLAKALAAKGSGVLVVHFQRGAADGLHMVAPYRDKRYRQLRGALALKEPGNGEEGPIDLGDGFGLHPALAPLYPYYKKGQLAVVHNVGSPDPTRSHFDAQDYMESGTPGRKATRDGWLSRAIDALGAGADSPFAALSLTSNMPRSLAGCTDAIAMQDFSKLGGRSRSESLAERIEQMYRDDDNPEFAQAGEEAFRAVEMFREKDPLSLPPGAGYPNGRFSQSFQQLARLVKSDLGVRVAFLDSGGWDTHFAQGAATGQMANLMRNLSGSIAALMEDVGFAVPVTFLTMTEFGRTVAINGAGGTDHGHGSAMMALGNGVKGGRVLGDWLGLASTDLYEGRDLPVTTDFRDLFDEVATKSLNLGGGATLFPSHTAKKVGVMA